MADLTLRLTDARLREGLAAAVDREGKVPRALDLLGPISGRRVVLIEGDHDWCMRRLQAVGGIVTAVSPADLVGLPAASADVVVTCRSAIRPGEEPAAEQVAQAMRVLDPAGRLLVVHDYGRDDVTALLGPPARAEQLEAWSHRQGPFLANGFKLRVLHCWWSWDTLEEATAFLALAFGEAGAVLAATLRRPRLSYKVAVYHRDHEVATPLPGAAA